MLTESQASPTDRYLLCNYFFPDAMIKKLKADVKSFMADRKKDDLYYEFIDWKKKTNELMVLTMYAYADISLPKQFDIAFQIDTPDNFDDTIFVINKAIINGWTSVNQIDHGHKHILIIEFPDTVPSIFKLLPAFSDSATNGNMIQLGLCSKTDFKAIKENLKYQK